jgi:hypothetical protein
VYCCVCPTVSETDEGATETDCTPVTSRIFVGSQPPGQPAAIAHARMSSACQLRRGIAI